jgi:hypothetical protein
MGERTTRFCDECDKTIDEGAGFIVNGSILPLGAKDNAGDIPTGDYCNTCLGKKLGMTPDFLNDLAGRLEELIGHSSQLWTIPPGHRSTPGKCGVASGRAKSNVVDVVIQSLDDLAELAAPSEATKTKVREMGDKVQAHWSSFSEELKAGLKKVFIVDETNPDEVEVTPHTDDAEAKTPTEDEMLSSELEPDFESAGRRLLGESALETAVSRVKKATNKINITPKIKKKKK